MVLIIVMAAGETAIHVHREFMMMSFDEGLSAGRAGFPVNACPSRRLPAYRDEWMRGWRYGVKERKSIEK
jgi:ribosome modulation factor